MNKNSYKAYIFILIMATWSNFSSKLLYSSTMIFFFFKAMLGKALLYMKVEIKESNVRILNGYSERESLLGKKFSLESYILITRENG